jgi:hypothetical protein
MDRFGVPEAALVLGEGLGREHLQVRSPPPELPAEVVDRVGPYQLFRQVVGLGEEESVTVGYGQVLIYRLEDLAGGDTI